jgi:ABC-type nitrate/sulfonate/bicarbonate transport system substrate-binding protein
MAGMATLLGLRARPAAPEPPPETTTLTLAKVPSICSAPLAVAEELFKAEGFREVQFVKKTTVAESYEALASAELHFNFQAIGGPSSSNWMRACRWSSSPGSIPGATSCSPPIRSVPSGS